MHSENLNALVKSAQLVEIITFELNAKRSKGTSSLSEGVPLQIEVQPQYNLEIGAKPDNLGFIVKLSLQLELPHGTIRCEVGATYSLKNPIDFPLDTSALIEYSNEVAVMTLLPFMRQHIADLSQRVLGFPLLMPILLRGVVHFDLEQVKTS